MKLGVCIPLNPEKLEGIKTNVKDLGAEYLEGNYYVLSNLEQKDFNKINSDTDIEMIVYGRIELMITKYCPLNMLLNNDNKKCNLCLNEDKYYLKDEQNREYPLIHSKHITYIMHNKNLNLFNNIDEYKSKGVNCFRLELFDEDRDTTIELIDKLKGVLYEWFIIGRVKWNVQSIR